MQSNVYSGLGDLEAQAVNKEREWKELQARRIHLLEDSLEKANKECLCLRHQNQRLKKDFQYNLEILDERDRELERYDMITSKAVTAEQNRQEELSQLRIQVAMLEERQAKDAEARQKEQLVSQNKAAQHKLQLEELRHSMTGKIQKQMEEHERVKLELQHRIQEQEGEIMRLRQVMTTAMDKKLKEHEHEFNLKRDEMQAMLLSRDLKIKLLSKDTEIQSQAKLEANEVLKASDEFLKQLQAQLQQKDQVMDDITNVKDVRIKQLEDKLKQVEKKIKKKEDDRMKKNKDMIQTLKEKEKQLNAHCQANKKHLQKAEERIVKLQDDIAFTSAQTHSAQRDMQMALGDKDDTIKRLRVEINTSQTAWESYMHQTSSEMVAKDAELIGLRESNHKLKAELERSREEIKRYKQDVSAGLKREADLQQSRVQVELECQRRCEDAKVKHYLANEQLIQDLTQARDQAKAELREKEKELRGLTVSIPSVKKGQDNGVQQANKKGLMPRTDVQTSEEIRSLMEQNNMLRAVVSQMRKNMEDLSDLQQHPQPTLQNYSTDAMKPHEAPAATSIPSATEPLAKHSDISANTTPADVSDHTEALKQEALLRAHCRQLERKLQGVSGLLNQVPAESLVHTSLGKPHPHDNGSKTGHCLEKHADNTFLRKQVVRGLHANASDQTALVQHLQHENPYQQQLTSSLTVGTASPRNNAEVRARLKQAVCHILQLSQEKQQLIQMGNCLRARITLNNDSTKENRDCVMVEQGRQHDRLSALEELQYKLTTQELQYAVRQMACRAFDGTGPPIKGDDDDRSRGHNTPDESETSKMSDVSSSVNQLQNSLEVKMQSSSDDTLPSLKAIWEILDHGLSSSIHSEGEGELNRIRATKPGSVGVMVSGTSAPIHRHRPTEFQQNRKPYKAAFNPAKNATHEAPDKISRIRNYNVKD
ncbi:coiled-coil domain-containing protein 57 isoform X2 [Nerophis lumbriciformis]|nr:coiled-coil domain-containing protein 57 isoform X2 [Nerophis lumbriciformis]XP_061823048.1 coiled-coil domain-containing protein 57 isoform X2 [Nerophis lumbriciformis]XP_061823049.1 coiled-coil domain-containing protein 57 isoform X2 [Nerophis lumbriciformis]